MVVEVLFRTFENKETEFLRCILNNWLARNCFYTAAQ